VTSDFGYADQHISGGMTFQDMVLRASQGVLDYTLDDFNGKSITVFVDKDGPTKDAVIYFDVECCRDEQVSPGPSSSFW